MGFGDVKLALVMGLFLGWLGWAPNEEVLGPVRLVLYALMLGCLTGVVFGIGHAAITRRRGEFPFGPALAAACIVVTIWLPDPAPGLPRLPAARGGSHPFAARLDA